MIGLNTIKIHAVPESDQREETDQIVVKIAREIFGNNISKADIIR